MILESIYGDTLKKLPCRKEIAEEDNREVLNGVALVVVSQMRKKKREEKGVTDRD